ncbi:MAG TPA: GlxA family transcriptional regulator [Solirubrobacterales bacterium]|nr:GlxA family transcriptional regulator [Solirubrobacterales bacterium]
MASADPQPIVFVGFEGLEVLDVTGPWEVFNTAGLIAGSPPELRLLTPDGGDVRCSSGLSLRADGAIDAHRGPIGTLVVPGGLGVRAALRDPELVAAVASLAGRAERVAGVCTGAFVLAEAGLLDGHRATTHWASCERLAERYPEVRVEADPIFVRDGNVVTSAGVTAGMDLALALVEEDLGSAAALQTAQMLVIYARRPGGQAQFSVQLSHQLAEREPIRELQGWIGEHLDEDLSVATLAGRVHLSERQFARVFRREVGATPADWVEQLRVERARSVLETDPVPLDAVASRCGFAGAEVMRRVFQRRLGTSPSEYRQRFRPPLAA